MDDISNNIDEILHALDIPIDSDDDNCDNFLSDDELLDGLEDLDVFQVDLHPNIEENIDLNVQNDIAVEKERSKSPAYRRKTQRVLPDISNNKKTNKRPISPVKVYSNVDWKNGNLIMNEQFIKFSGNTDLPTEIKKLYTPLEFFKYFFDDILLEKILYETIQFSIEKNVNKPLKISLDDLKKFIGILVMMSIINLPNSRSFWNETIGNNIIQNTMSVNKFEEIRKNLHFNDNNKMLPAENPEHDRLHKIRPLITHLQEKCKSIPLEENLSIDEQICPTKSRSFLKMYMPLKPHKWGYKLFVLCGVSGFSYNFEVYTGLENNSEKRLPSEPNLGACANVVMRLSRCIPENINHKLYFDNYYTTLAVMVELAKKNIHCLGTLRKNRIPGLLLPNENEMKKKPRGFSAECLAGVDGIPITAIQWKDNKTVSLLSTFVGKEPISEVQRFDKKLKKRIPVECPKVVQVYNKHMGGVDLLDSIIGRYRIAMRSKKWYFKLFYHFLDMSLVNAWLLYRRAYENEATIPLAKFRQEVAVALCQSGMISTPTRGRKKKEETKNYKKRGN